MNLERFTDRANKIMGLANACAQKYNHEYIGTEHILVGIIQEEAGVAHHALVTLGITKEIIEKEIEKIVQYGPDMVTMGKLPLTPRGKKVIEFAYENARSLGHHYVGTEHLLLGLMDEKDGVGSQVLQILAGTEKIKQEVYRLLLGISKEDEVLEAISEHPIEKKIEMVSKKLWETTGIEDKTSADLHIIAAIVNATGEIVKAMLIKGI